ncbi:hypothetical protein F5884DRAFT_496574 [Xylogone sp. PMI_703]|nr:hypothetical protein F5884DRAFT_496574 [Xylogone sp. PMI_703]
MDPDYIDEDEEASAMAAAMGFSSFGTQPNPNKKRKFNSATDAFVEGQQLAELYRGGKKGQGTGGNQIPLGKPRVIGASSENSKKNSDEIDLGEDEEEEPAVEEKDEEEGPQYIDTSLPPPVESQRKVQEQIDSILANAGSSTSGSTTLPPSQNHLRGPASDAGSIAGSSRPAQRGQRNEFWYVGYYDPSFNENPWARLEQEKGLKTSGTWVERTAS